MVGIDKSKLVVDPGLGFGKRKEQNSVIIANLGRLSSLELPILVGPSRKHFLAHEDPQDTKYATAAAVAACILGGAHLVRVHDVREMRAVANVADEVLQNKAIQQHETR
jgi:dihydropteroate synthase